MSPAMLKVTQVIKFEDRFIGFIGPFQVFAKMTWMPEPSSRPRVPQQFPQRAAAVARAQNHSTGKAANMAAVHQDNAWTETQRSTIALRSIQSGRRVSLASQESSKIILGPKIVQLVLVATSQSMAPAVFHVKMERFHHQITTTRFVCPA